MSGTDRLPFTTAHHFLIELGYVLFQIESDLEDIGTGETGPMMSGSPAFDEYASNTHKLFFGQEGRLEHQEFRDLALEAAIEEWEAEAQGGQK